MKKVEFVWDRGQPRGKDLRQVRNASPVPHVPILVLSLTLCFGLLCQVQLLEYLRPGATNSLVAELVVILKSFDIETIRCEIPESLEWPFQKVINIPFVFFLFPSLLMLARACIHGWKCLTSPKVRVNLLHVVTYIPLGFLIISGHDACGVNSIC